MKRIVPLLLGVIAACSSKSAPATVDDDGGAADAGAGDAAPAEAGDPFQAVHDVLFGGQWLTEGVVIMVKGQIVYEEYAGGYTADNPHLTYSVSKSIGSALVGIAINDGLMKLTDSVCTYVTPPMGADPSLCDTTIEDLLHMSSGLSWSEDYGTDPTTSNVLQMLYSNTDDMGAYAAGLPRAAPAASKWNYSSGDADILALAFKNALKGQDARAYAKSKLFDPAAVKSWTFESDRSGSLVFSSSWFATPRDMAKIGQLYLDDGMVGATRVLPTGWVKYSITPASSVATPSKRDPMVEDSGGSYGAQWWLNTATPTATVDTYELPDVPADEYAALGHYGQMIAIVPSRQMVMVRVGDDRTIQYDPNPWLKSAVAAVDALNGTSSGATMMNATRPRPNRVHGSAPATAPSSRTGNVSQILTGFSAKETCSCAFVVGQTDDYCKAFGQQSGFNIAITIDHTLQKVTSVYTSTTRTASAKPGVGCTLDSF